MNGAKKTQKITVIHICALSIGFHRLGNYEKRWQARQCEVDLLKREIQSLKNKDNHQPSFKRTIY